MAPQSSFVSRSGSKFLLIIMALLLLACAAVQAATATPVPTSTSTFTPTVRPSSTPKPTYTPTPTNTPVPTPADIGDPVSSNGLEFTVIGAVNRDRVYPGGVYLYTPKSGSTFLDVGIKISNSNPGSSKLVLWSDVYVVEENGDTWYPYWSGEKAVTSGKKFDPFTLGIDVTDGSAHIAIDEDVYLRLIFIVSAGPEKTVLFRIGDSPAVEIAVKK
jgi:hypothetical protein